MADQSICKIEGCGKRAAVRGWCSGHYHRWQRHGDPLKGRLVTTPAGEAQKYLFETVLKYEGDECLTWPFSKPNGKSGIKWEGRMQSASRLVCKMVNGPPPTAKHHAAHSCGHGHLACVTKRHLSWKTPKENNADKIAHGTRQNGERHPMARLTEAKVAAIRADKDSLRKTAAKYGVGFSTISAIRRGVIWAV